MKIHSRVRLFGPALVVLALAGCGGGESDNPSLTAGPVSGTPTPSPAPTATPAATPTASPTPTPSPTATTAGTPVPAPSLAGLDPVSSGIGSVDDYLQPAWGTGDIPGHDVDQGAFRFLCAPSHNAYDDPVVYPGQSGKSHLHTFYGNTLADANSSYQSLRTTGDSTCNNFLNRSAYWMPALMNGKGKVVMADYAQIYYKRMPASDPRCAIEATACVALPRGLRFVFGFNMSSPSNSGLFYWNCDGAGGVSGHFPDIAQAAAGCPVGARIGAVVVAPICWNGTQLDSADHRSHLAYQYYDTWGQPKCDAAHPYIIPQFQIAAWFTTDSTLDRSGNESATADTWYLSSDRMPGMAWAVPGTTLHSDWFGAWEDSIMERWTSHCIDLLLSCNGGDLGNGKQLKTSAGYGYGNSTVLVDPPVHP
ncbi:MAG: DUF1996 domain-containing protein [Sphingomonas sp.]|uniref:DUF1996 domain-containing protein n=1 Tax=Sphingomonas sp. TaxID=28214 RepID=UPI001ACBFEE2|nr:DUF1996 domain-containing protein [Sphingomonas sp.]MBN8806688.1 DUF1996 domain-containing protein [Sphingomonas sp.]